MRAGRPRSQEMPHHSPLEGESQKPGRELGTLLNYWNSFDRRFLNSGYSTTSPAHPRVCPPPARLRAPPSRRLPLKGGVILER